MAKKEKATHGHNANYGFEQHAPQTPMGHGDFANLPKQPKFMSLDPKWEMRDGLRNSPTVTINEISGVDENMR